MGFLYKKFSILLLMTLLVACAPENRKIISKQERSKIELSAFSGSSFDVSAFNVHRLFEAKRIMDLALNYPTYKAKFELESAKAASEGQGYTGCQWITTSTDKDDKNRVIVQVVSSKCQPKSSFVAITDVYALELLDITYTTLKGKSQPVIKEVKYSAPRYKVVLRARNDKSTLMGSSRSDIYEERSFHAFLTEKTRVDASMPKYQFFYEVKSDFTQTLRDKNYEAADTNGWQKFVADGSFYVDDLSTYNIKYIEDAKMEFRMNNPRAVSSKRGPSTRLMFTNANNFVESRMAMEIVVFEPDCGLPQGNLQIFSYFNKNEKRNRFYIEEDEAVKKMSLDMDILPKHLSRQPEVAASWSECQKQDEPLNLIPYELVYMR